MLDGVEWKFSFWDIVFWIFFKFLNVGAAQTVCSYRENLESYFWRRFCRKKNRKASSSVNKSWDFREKLPKIFSLSSLHAAHTFYILFMKVSVLYFMVDLKLTWCNVPKNEKYSPGKSESFNVIFFFSDEVDQLSYSGYGTVSDDDRLSIMSGGSLASDGGVTITTWRHLSLAEKQ